MKITDKTRFPHPVLSNFTGDYNESRFSIEIHKIDEIIQEGKITIHFNSEISEKAIAELVENKKGKIGLFVVCLETHYNKLETIEINQTSFKFIPGTLHGRVRIRPVIWVDQEVEDFTSDNLHEEFGNEPRKLILGEVIAVGEEQVFVAGRQKLAPMETIFKLGKDESVLPNQIMVRTDSDKIKILASKKTYSFIHKLRNTSVGKNILLNSIYLPAVIEVLSTLQELDEAVKGKRWYRTFSLKCDHLGINPENGEMLRDAQELLKSPFHRIEECKEIASL